MKTAHTPVKSAPKTSAVASSGTAAVKAVASKGNITKVKRKTFIGAVTQAPQKAVAVVFPAKKAARPFIKTEAGVFAAAVMAMGAGSGIVKLTKEQLQKRQMAKRSPRKQGGVLPGKLTAGKLKSMAVKKEAAPTVVK